jgi:hypothetical protein
MHVDPEEAPPRLTSQLYPSTNTILITVLDDLEAVVNLQKEIFNILQVDVTHLQCLDFSHYDLLRQIRATFFDVRDTWRAFVHMQSDSRFHVELDLIVEACN